MFIPQQKIEEQIWKVNFRLNLSNGKIKAKKQKKQQKNKKQNGEDSAVWEERNDIHKLEQKAIEIEDEIFDNEENELKEAEIIENTEERKWKENF